MQFYAATAGREAAELVSLSLSVETVTGNFSASPLSGVAQLVPLSESSLPLGATVLTLTIAVSGDEFGFGTAGGEATSLAPGPAVSFGQSFLGQGRSLFGAGAGSSAGDLGDDAAPGASAALAPWQRFVLGLDEAIEKFQRDNPNGVPAGKDDAPASGQPGAAAASERPRADTGGAHNVGVDSQSFRARSRAGRDAREW